MKHLRIFLSVALAASPVIAKDRVPLPDTVWDGGVISSESMGRGRTFSANMSNPASGSENPASLNDTHVNATYATVRVGQTSDLSTEQLRASDPLRNRTIQYLSMQGEKGVVYYEPLSRYSGTEELDGRPGTADLEYSANAIGFAGADKWGKNGAFGLSIAYLWSSLASVEHVPGEPDQSHLDEANGLRINFGARRATGPVMWGLTFQNMPAFLWGGGYKRQQLPPTIRVGNTWRAAPGVLLSVDFERRYYNEGGNDKGRVYVGLETFSGERVVLRAGTYGEDLGKPEKRHVTAGIGLRPQGGMEVAYAYESYELEEERVQSSYVSLKYPFDTAEEETSQR